MSTSRIAGIVLLALCLATFAGAGRNGFVVLDDDEYVTGNPMVARGLGAEGVAWAFGATRAGNWHPMTWLSHQLDASLFGLRPGGHHLTSVALHAGSALLLFLLLCDLTGGRWRSFAVAALFAVHPLRVESVAWAAERKDVLALFFTLLALRAYVKSVRRPGGSGGLGAAGYFALALLAKPASVTLPFLLLLLDWWPLGRWAPGPERPGGLAPPILGLLPGWLLWREKVPLLLLAAASSAITYVVQARGGAVRPADVLPLAQRAANAVHSYVAYLADTFWPADLAVFYPLPLGLPPWPSLIGSALLLVVVMGLAWRLRRAQPWLPVGWLWYLGTLVPMIGLIQVGEQARADRYTYLPHLGLLAALVWGAASAASGGWGWRGRRTLAVAGCAAVTVLAGITVAQVSRWRSSVELLGHALSLEERRAAAGAVSSARGRAFLHNALGVAYADEGRLDAAGGEYQAAVAADPSFAEAVNNLGRAREDQGRLEEAAALYARAVALSPGLASARSNLGGLLLGSGRIAGALALLREAAGIDPLNATVRANLGAALALAGEAPQAERELRAAVALDPDNEPARFNLGKFLLDQGRPAEAAAQLRESLRLLPGQAAAGALLAEALARAGSGRR